MKTSYLIYVWIAIYIQAQVHGVYGCEDGYWGNQCKYRCTQNCQQCNRYNGLCSNCNDGFYVDIIGYCGYCPYDCRRCSNPYTCLECKPGYYKSGNYCYKCSVNCISCTDASNCNACETGYYGTRCHFICSSGCQGSFCNKDNGACTCSAGFTGSKCDTCKVGYYGDECRPCSYGCQDDCDGNRGTCRCKALYTGPLCDKCVDGWYGHNCTQACRQNCKSCIDEHTCLSCRQGFYGLLCGNVCPNNCLTCESMDKCLECKPGYYGNACQMLCGVGCPNGVCDKQSGDCSPCINAYRDRNCTHKCSEGCVDKLCGQNDAICTYGCIGGYSGAYCCQPGVFGRSCEINCPTNCATCTSLYQCQSCKDGFYGSTCNQICPVNCVTCFSQWNCPVCNNGYTGDTCQISCPKNCLTCSHDVECVTCKGEFSNCNMACSNTCFNASCHMNGTCTNGCITDYYGPSCEQSCSTNCARSGNGTRCSLATGLCLFGCIEGFQGEGCVGDNAYVQSLKPDNSKNIAQAAAIGGGVAAVVIVALVVVVGISIFIRRRNRTPLYDNVVREANADSPQHRYDGIHMSVSVVTAKECSTTVVSTNYQNTSDRPTETPEQSANEEHTYEIAI